MTRTVPSSEPTTTVRRASLDLAARGAGGRRAARAVAVLVGLILGVTACAPVMGVPEPAAQEERAGQGDAGAVGVEGGLLTEAASPYDTELPAIGNLDPALVEAVQQAADAAEADGITILVTSGWRSAAFQQTLLDGAIARYGSEEEALRYVNSPKTSRHVLGEAVDIGPTDADSWFSQRGDDFGLCQTYANEMWHFELATTPGAQCPPMLPDAGQG